MQFDPPTITFADLAAQQADNEKRAQSIKATRAQIKAFKGLPPVRPHFLVDSYRLLRRFLFILFLSKETDVLRLSFIQNLDLARQQLKTARAAQMELLQIRERLLGRMAESVV
jgi:hypothetical protein